LHYSASRIKYFCSFRWHLFAVCMSFPLQVHSDDPIRADISKSPRSRAGPYVAGRVGRPGKEAELWMSVTIMRKSTEINHPTHHPPSIPTQLLTMVCFTYTYIGYLPWTLFATCIHVLWCTVLFLSLLCPQHYFCSHKHVGALPRVVLSVYQVICSNVVFRWSPGSCAVLLAFFRFALWVLFCCVQRIRWLLYVTLFWTWTIIPNRTKQTASSRRKSHLHGYQQEKEVRNIKQNSYTGIECYYESNNVFIEC
jgi:hypothetical protein